MSSPEGDVPGHAPSVFLSYASEDRAAARSLRDALEAAGVDVWYDESELGGGDAWDKKIRGQIRDCTFFMPVVSARTEARKEGYFRREWRLAVDRTHDMADDVLFLVPVAIDGTDQASARVPERFQSVQWLRVPEGRPTPALEALGARLAAGDTHVPTPKARRAAVKAARLKTPLPPVPHEEPGQRLRYLFLMVQWALHSGWILFRRLPRILQTVLATVFLMSLLSTHSAPKDGEGRALTAEQRAALKAEAKKAVNTVTVSPSDAAKIGTEFARELASDLSDDPDKTVPVLALPFSAPAEDAEATKLAGSAFTFLFGQISAAHPSKVGISRDPLIGADLAEAARARGHARRSRCVVFGAVSGTGADRRLTVGVVDPESEAAAWSKSYPVAGADPAAIAADVATHISTPDE
jgi:hypothetical protein